MNSFSLYASGSEDDEMDVVVEEASGQEAAAGQAGAGEGAQSSGEPESRAGKRIEELNEVEESIAQLLHLAGYTMASLHPDPMSSFTSRTMSLDDSGSSEGGSPKPRPPPVTDDVDKSAEFPKYAEAYYATLNDIQLSLRTSIRHLRLSRGTTAPLIDPQFGSLANTSAESAVAGGGVAFGPSLRPILPEEPAWGTTGTEARGQLSVGAMRQEKEAWVDLGRALEAGSSDT